MANPERRQQSATQPACYAGAPDGVEGSTPSRSADQIDHTESFWWCVERVCRRVDRRASYGQFPLAATTAAMARQVLDQMAQVKETGVVTDPFASRRGHSDA